MADHAKPTLTTAYATFLSELMARIDDVAKGNNSGLVLTNPPVNTIRWNTSTSKWEKNTGTVAVPDWSALTTTYGINVATADALSTGRTIGITQDAVGSGTFTGAGNLSFAVTLATVNTNTGQWGSGTAVPVITVDGKGRITAISTAALGSMAAQSAASVAITGGTATLTQALGAGSGHTYNTAGLVAQGNGAANTVYPSIGFHQPGLYGAVLQCRGGSSFYFYNLTGDTLGSVYAGTFYGALSGNANTSSSCSGNAATATTASACSGNAATATSATKASTLAQGGGAGAGMAFNWVGQGGQPPWLWGGSDGINHYVYNPSNFSVNYATSAGTCTTATNLSGGTVAATSGATWISGTFTGVGGTDKGVIGNLSGVATFGGHNSGLSAWTPVALSGSTAALQVNGSTIALASSTGLAVTGALSSTGNSSAYSDETVKTNWRSFGPDFITNLANLKSGIYDRTDTELTQVGVGAQSLQKFMRHAVITGADGKLSVAYGNAALASCVELAKEAVELRGVIATQQAMIDTLVARLDRLTE